jgi:RimJ/RimL family protein N-acetyltransferase
MLDDVQHDLTLTGHGVRLVPLAPEHAPGLAAFVDARVWAGMSSALPVGDDAWLAEVESARAAPGRLAFAALDAATGEVRGSTSFYDWDPRIRRVEIGHTYFAPRWWGTDNNPACKLLMLRHAFETWGCARVALRRAGGRAAEPPPGPRRHPRGHGVLLDPAGGVAGGPRRPGRAAGGRPLLTDLGAPAAGAGAAGAGAARRGAGRASGGRRRGAGREQPVGRVPCRGPCREGRGRGSHGLR